MSRLYVLVPALLWSMISTGYSQSGSIPLFSLKFSQEIQEAVDAGELSPEAAAEYYSFIGRYGKALATYDMPLRWGFDTLTSEDSLALQGYHPTGAFQVIAKLARSKQIVMISEAPHKPQHRLFTQGLLEQLYREGFRYLGLETLAVTADDSSYYLADTALQRRGYPLFSPLTGRLVQEPRMAQLIRHAHSLGYRIFGYDSVEEGVRRDLRRAENIARFMRNHPAGKVVIHGSEYGVIESEWTQEENGHWMAYHLKQLTGIDPLTIYQNVLSERDSTVENPYYSLVSADEISVLVNDTGNVYRGPAGMEHFDVLVYHPPTTYYYGRPGWLLRSDKNQLYEPPIRYFEDLTYPCLVMAYNTQEGPRSVPLDIVEKQDRNEAVALILPKGKYELVIVDINRKRVSFPIVVR